MGRDLFLGGLGLGFSIAAPVGPIGVLCIRRSISDGAWKGLAAGLGAATADAFYGSVAGFGLTAVSGFLVHEQRWLALVGGLFLCYLGARTFFSRPAENSESTQDGALAIYGSTALLTLANPATLLSFAAAFSALGLAASASAASAASLVLGVFLGSALWWILLTTAVSRTRARLGGRWMTAVNRVSGLVLMGFGVFALAWR